MITIQKRRIRNVDKYLHSLPEGSQVQVSLANAEIHLKRLTQIGFSAELKEGERVLPSALGPISTFNADGLEKPQKDQEKEIAHREAMINCFGKKWVFAYITYKRYPRIKIPAPSQELTVEMRGESKIVTLPSVLYQPNNQQQKEILKHQINLCLEYFGECTILSEALFQMQQFKIERRNWRVLPTGEYPWNEVENILKNVTKALSPSKRRLVDGRFQYLASFNPTKLIIGEAGFDGYVVFCFENSNVYLLESHFTNNATYVFGDQWEALSQLTKAEILNGNLHEQRFIHKEGWADKIAALLNSQQAA